MSASGLLLLLSVLPSRRRVVILVFVVSNCTFPDDDGDDEDDVGDDDDELVSVFCSHVVTSSLVFLQVSESLTSDDDVTECGTGDGKS